MSTVFLNFFDFFLNFFGRELFLSATGTSFAISGAFDGGFSRRAEHFTAVTTLCLGFTIGAKHRIAVFFYQFVKLFAAKRANVL